jgi:hypothetical protein
MFWQKLTQGRCVIDSKEKVKYECISPSPSIRQAKISNLACDRPTSPLACPCKLSLHAGAAREFWICAYARWLSPTPCLEQGNNFIPSPRCTSSDCGRAPPPVGYPAVAVPSSSLSPACVIRLQRYKRPASFSKPNFWLQNMSIDNIIIMMFHGYTCRQII